MLEQRDWENGEARYRVNPDYILRDIAGEHILIPVGSAAVSFSGLISLNDSGVLLWHKLQAECTEGELTDALLSEYETDRGTAAADVAKFLGQMREAGLLLADSR